VGKGRESLEPPGKVLQKGRMPGGQRDIEKRDKFQPNIWKMKEKFRLHPACTEEKMIEQEKAIKQG